MNHPTKKLTTYISEFKESVVKLAIESDELIAQIARDLGVNPNTLDTFSNYSNPKNTKEIIVKIFIAHSQREREWVREKA